MKALSLWEPWASLLMEGYKRIVVCPPLHIPFRGPLVIHATGAKSIRTPLHMQSWVTAEFMWKARELLGGFVAGVNTHPGMALGTARLVHIVPVEEIRSSLSPLELLLDDYSDGQTAWIFTDVHKFKKPFPARGRAPLWDLDDAILKKHKEKVPE